MNHKNLLKNMTNNSRSLLMVVLLIVLVVLAYRYQREGFADLNINKIAKSAKGDKGGDGASALNLLKEVEANNLPDGFEIKEDDNAGTLLDKVISYIKEKVHSEITTQAHTHAAGAAPDHTHAAADAAEHTHAAGAPAEHTHQVSDAIIEKIDEKIAASGSASGSGVPPGTVIIYHLDTGDNKKFFDDYLGENQEILVGGFDDDGELIEDYDGDPIPYGFQVCNGAELQKIKVNDDGSKELKRTRVNTPDYRGRFLIGGAGDKGAKGSVGTGDLNNDNDDHYTKDSPGALKQRAWKHDRPFYQGQKGGSDMHQLLTKQMPRHNHTANSPAHSHGTFRFGCKGLHCQGAEPKGYGHAVDTHKWEGNDGHIGGTHGAAVTVNIGHAGENKPHNNMPPFTPVLYLIKI